MMCNFGVTACADILLEIPFLFYTNTNICGLCPCPCLWVYMNVYKIDMTIHHRTNKSEKCAVKQHCGKDNGIIYIYSLFVGFACSRAHAAACFSFHTICVRVHLTYREMQSIFEPCRGMNWVSGKLQKRSRERERDAFRENTILAAKWLDFGEWRPFNIWMHFVYICAENQCRRGIVINIYVHYSISFQSLLLLNDIFYLHLWPKLVFFPVFFFISYSILPHNTAISSSKRAHTHLPNHIYKIPYGTVWHCILFIF